MTPFARLSVASLVVLALLLGVASRVAAQDGTGACVENLRIASDHDARRVTLTWDAVAGAASIDVHRARDGGASEHLATLPGNATEFVDFPAPEGVLDYRVASDGHPSLDCPAVSVHLGGEPVPPGEPTCVGGLLAEALEGPAIRLSWPALSGASSYEVLRAVGDAPVAPYGVVGGGATTFTDEAVEPGVAYRYAVSANGLPPEGERCEEATATAVPLFPSALAAALPLVAAVALVGLRRRR